MTFQSLSNIKRKRSSGAEQTKSDWSIRNGEVTIADSQTIRIIHSHLLRAVVMQIESSSVQKLN